MEVINMPKPLEINLSPKEQQELIQIRDNHAKNHLRERAAAILKIAAGMSGRQVALKGLLKRRRPATVYDWVKRYRAEGVAGLKNKPGRGRKPAFSPKHAAPEAAKMALLHVLRRSPERFGYTQSRWNLRRLLAQCAWLRLKTEAGLWQLLKRLGISYKRGRDYVHSPDRHYWPKLSRIELARLRAWYEPEKYSFVYLDELTYYRQPTLARAYEAIGPEQPLARRSHRSNTSFRVLGALDAITGQLTYTQHSQITRFRLADFLAHLWAQKQPTAQLYVVVDNWPVHFHPDVLARLQPQQFPWPPTLPANWPTKPGPKAVVDNLPIQLLNLPTYASWLNPIEKVWRWLKQDVLHLHRSSDDWQQLKARVAGFLDQFEFGSLDLLRYVGLSV
jgi:transposase